MRLKANAACVQFAVKPLDLGFQERPLDFDRQVADTEVEQLFVAETLPGESVAHIPDSICVICGLSFPGPFQPLNPRIRVGEQ